MRRVLLHRYRPGIASVFEQARLAPTFFRPMSTTEASAPVPLGAASSARRKGKRPRAIDSGKKAMGKARKVDDTAKIFGTRSSPAKTSVIEKALDKAFGPLKLDDLHVKESIGSSKTRNHANPLGVKFLIPLDPPSAQHWATIYKDPFKPLFVDIGCAAGRFGIAAAKNQELSCYNHLGFEIRKPLVVRANAWAQRLGLGNCHYVLGSANSSMQSYLSTYPGPIQVIAVQFPDPHFKRKHQKRRVIQQEMLTSIASLLAVKGTLFVQSDVESIAAEMRDRALLSEYFERSGGPFTPRDTALTVERSAAGLDTDSKGESLWTRNGQRALAGAKDYGDWPVCQKNPFGVPTEREVQNTALGEPIYRAIFMRNDKPCSRDQTYVLKQTVKAGNILVAACKNRAQSMLKVLSLEEKEDKTAASREGLSAITELTESACGIIGNIEKTLPKVDSSDGDAALALAKALAETLGKVSDTSPVWSEYMSQLKLLEELLLHLANSAKTAPPQEGNKNV